MPHCAMRSIPVRGWRWQLNVRARNVPRLDQSFELTPTADDFVVVRVSGATPIDDFFGRQGVLPVAFTNPIFIDADGDGQTRWFPAAP